MIQELITRYKRMRTEHYLAQTYQYQYAFVGMGQHSLTNLYPVLQYIGVPLKYICVRSERKAHLITHRFPSVIVTTSLNEILQDGTVKGVFVCASPSAHFTLASQILKSGKSLFIEKPPCQTLAELDDLTNLQRLYGSPVAMAGLQKRYAPAVQLLKQRLRKKHLVNYDLHYLSGAYPEGNALLDLYIHPLDLTCYLFGRPEILACKRMAKDSFILMLQHPHVVGTLELSTAYTWTDAEESLKVCTHSGIYQLSQMDKLTFIHTPSTTFGIPMEKLRSLHKTTKYLCQRNNFTPILPNNQVYSQGYYYEIAAFVDAVENHCSRTTSTLDTMNDTYSLLESIKNY